MCEEYTGGVVGVQCASTRDAADSTCACLVSTAYFAASADNFSIKWFLIIIIFFNEKGAVQKEHLIKFKD